MARFQFSPGRLEKIFPVISSVRTPRGLIHAAQTAVLVQPAPELGVAGTGFPECRERARLVALCAAQHTACFPERGDPGAAVPHRRDAVGLVETSAHLVELADLDQHERSRGTKAHGADLAQVAT